MKILITGGKGYIANSIHKSLRDKYEIDLISRDDFDLTDSDKTNEYFKNRLYDVVIHTAIKGGSRLKIENASVIDDNLKMYYNLLDNRSKYKKFINLGSGAELYATNTPYGLSKKVIAESIQDKCNYFNLRIFAVFDENELETRFIKSNIKKYINKQPIEIYRDKYMSFFYMKDLIKTVDYYIENENPEKTFNCCYNKIYTLRAIANIINSLDEYKVDIIEHDLSMDKGYYGDNLWQPNIDYIGLELGIKQVYNKLK